MFVITLIFFGSLFLGGAATVIWLKEQWSVRGGK